MNHLSKFTLKKFPKVKAGRKAFSLLETKAKIMKNLKNLTD